jgi:hypothetical protein
MNYVFVRNITPNRREIIYVGETPSLFASLTQTPLWDAAKQQYGASELYGRVNGNEERRKQEQDDLVEAYKPPMNAADQG